MKKILVCISLASSVLACNNDDKKYGTSESDIDAARNFLQAALYSDFRKASTYMLQDTQNVNQMAAIERIHLSDDEKRGLAEASINIHKVTPLNDSTTIVVYSNSYKNNQDTLRVVKVAGKWLVDFDYIWNHDMDTLQAPPVLKTDTISK